MKSKLSWVPFIPVVFAAVFLRIYQVLFIDSGVDKGFLDSGMISLIFTGSIVLLFVLLAVFCFADKKTAPEYDIGRNILAGIFGVLTGAMLLTDAVITAMNMVQASAFYVVDGIDAVLSLFGGVMILVMGISSLTGKNIARKVPFLMLFPTIWCCGRLILTFMSYTAVSTASKDMSDLVYMVFATLFIFNASMVYTGIKGKNPVKACFLYGLPAVVVVFAYVGALLASQIQSGQNVYFLSNIRVFEFVSLSLYIIFFLIELTAGAKEKEALPKAEEENTESVQPVEDAVLTHENTRENLAPVAVSADPETARADAIMAQVEAGDKKQGQPLEYVGYYDRKLQDKKDKTNNGVSDYESKLDDIDRLILELSSQEDHK